MRFGIENKLKKYYKIFLFLIVLAIFSSTTYAYHYVCLNYGEAYPTGRICDRDCCRFCANENGWHTNPRYCSGLPSCSCGGGNFSDLEAPNITINSPIDKKAYFSRYMLIDVDLNEISYLYFMEKGRERYGWQRLCPGKCSKYSRARSFTDGEHTLTIRALDLRGNEKKKNVTFYVDSISPKIRKTYPRKGEYGKGQFTIEYSELNVVNITLYYKENGSTKFKNKTKEDCPSGTKEECTIEVEGLAQGPLTYYFSLTDKAQTVYSEETDIIIDTIPPVLDVTSPHNPLLIYNNKKILINLTVNEECDVGYIDYSDRRPKYKTLCRNCMGYSKTKSFGDSYHNITIRATDKAENKDNHSVEFIVDTKKPRIKRTLPRNRGYGNGNFTLIYDEENPVNVTLFYKQNETDLYQSVSNYNCPAGKNVRCSILVEGLDQGDLYYYFSIIDLANWSTTQRRESLITIDTIDPFFIELSSPENKTYDDRRVWFTANISEEVTLEYFSHYSPRASWKRLCTKCDYYDRYKTFIYDDYYLTVRARDYADNIVAEDFMFTVKRP